MSGLGEAAAGEAMNAAAEGAPGLIRTSMNIIIQCDRKDLKLRFRNHFVKGGAVSQSPDRGADYTKQIKTEYISDFFRKGLKGLLICQVQRNESEFSDDTFIAVGWKAPLTGSAQIYVVLVEAGRDDFSWEPMSAKDLYDSFRGRFKTYTKEFKETWSLENNTNIKLTTGLGGDKDYNLKVTIHEDELNDGDYLPVRITPKSDDKNEDRPTDIHIKQPKPILPKPRDSVKISIMNKCNDIILGSGTCTILEGFDRYNFKDPLPPSDSQSTVVKSKHLIGRTKSCIVYELANFTNPTIPLWLEYRVFLAVQVFTKPFSDKNKATAILFKIKDRKFDGGKNAIEELHKDVLQHSMRRPHRAAIWNLDGQALLLKPKFEFNVPASVEVTLEQSNLNIEHDPIFHRTGTFASPSKKAIGHITNVANTSKSIVQYQVLESKLKSNGENINALQVERFYVATIDEEKVERAHNQSNSHKDENFYIYTETPPATDNTNLYMYSIFSKNPNTNMGVVFLKQKPIYMVHSRYSDSAYQAKLLYMDAPSLKLPSHDGVRTNLNSKQGNMGKNHDDHEAMLLAKRYESIFGKDTFAKFKTGELFERPLRLLDQPLACVSVHEPLARPPVLSLIVQDPVVLREIHRGNVDTRAGHKKYSIRLTLKNYTEAGMKLHSYVSSAPPLSKLPDVLSYSNEDTPDNLEFELPKDSEHGIWIRYRYVDDEACGFDVRIRAKLPKYRDVVVSTDIYYIDGQGEKRLLSRKATYDALYEIGETTRYRVSEGTDDDEEVGRAFDTATGARVQHDIVSVDGWDLCASIEVQFLLTTF